MKLPDITSGDFSIKVILKFSDNIHDIKGIEGQVLHKIGVISEPFFACNFVYDVLNQLQHTMCLLLRFIAFELPHSGFRKFFFTDGDHLDLLVRGQRGINLRNFLVQQV